MHVSTTVRATLLVCLAAGLAACSDSPSAPRNLRPMTASASRGSGRQNTDNSTQSTTFTVDPTQTATYKFGNHAVTFPAGSICDPATSGYDPSLWDAPCTPLSTPITITATWSNKHGHAYVDFEPSLRFVPSQTVTLTLKDTPAMQADGQYTILWLRPSDGTWVQESAVDPSEQEVPDFTGNTISRRIKHFSGYNVSAGAVDSCDPTLNPDWCLSTTSISY